MVWGGPREPGWLGPGAASGDPPMRRTLVAMVLAASAANATSPAHLLDPFWTFVSALWGAPVSASPLQSDGGCGLDPSGRCLPAPPTQQLEIGCGLDPDGRCNPSS